MFVADSLFFYYKMQVVFKDFRQRSDFCTGGIFTLKKLINWRAMPIVVLLYSQYPKLNSISQLSNQLNFTKIHSKIFDIPIRTKSNKSLPKHKIKYNQKYLLKTYKSSNPTKPPLRNPNKILNKLRLNLKYTK